MTFNATTHMAKAVDWVWRKTIQETDEFGAPTWKWMSELPTRPTNILGEKWKVRDTYNESESYAGFDGPAFAQGGNSTLQNLFVPYRTVSTQMLVTKEAIDNDGPTAKYHPVVNEIAITLKAAFKKLNRAVCMGDGTARIAEVTANYAGGSPTLVTCAPGTEFGNKGAQFVKPGKKIQIYSSDGVTLRDGTIGGEAILTVSSVNKVTGVITCTTNAPSDMVDGDIVVPERSGGRGINGIPYWVANTGSLFELARATYPGLNSILVNGASGAILNLVEELVSASAFHIETAVAYGDEGQAGEECLHWSPTQRENFRKESIGNGIRMEGGDAYNMGAGFMEKLNGFKGLCDSDNDNTRIRKLRKGEWYRLSVHGAKTPFKKEQIHGTDMYNLYDSSSRIASGYGCVFSGYVNVGCENVRNQSEIHSLPTTGLATGNV